MGTGGDYAQLVKELINPAHELRIAIEATGVPAQGNGSRRTQVLLSATARNVDNKRHAVLVVQKTVTGRWNRNPREVSVRDNDKKQAKNVSRTWMSTYGTVTTHQVLIAVKCVYSHDNTLNPAHFIFMVPCILTLY